MEEVHGWVPSVSLRAFNNSSVLSIALLLCWWLTVFFICVSVWCLQRQERALDPLELELQVTVTHPDCDPPSVVSGSELGSSGKVAFLHGAVSAAPLLF